MLPKNVGEKLIPLLVSSVIQSPSPILITDRKGLIEYVNPMFTKITGYSLDEIKGKTPRILKSPRTPATTYEDLWQTILSGETWQGEICNRKKNGEEFWESISINCIRDAQGAITHFVGIWQEITERRKSDEEIRSQKESFEKQSRTDELTGIYNRRHIFVELEREFERARRYGRPLSGMMVDIDNFKKISDQYGHPIGDRVIRTFAKVLERSIREIDILGRYGGDEFLVILPETSIQEARKVAERIRRTLSGYQKNVVGEFGILTASLGLVTLDESCREDKALFLEKVDKVLFLAKQAGRNIIVEG